MPIFKEEQRFTQWWLWLILSILTLVPFVMVTKQPELLEHFESTTTSVSFLVLFLIPVVFVILVFGVTKLKTNIDETGISVHLFPFLKRNFAWSDIQSAQVVNYGFIGGWGIRLSKKYGTVFNLKGSDGIQIILKNGQKYVIGTQKKEVVKEVLERHQS